MLYGLGSAHPKVKLELKISLTSAGSKLFVYNVKLRQTEVHMESRASYFSMGLYYHIWEYFPLPCLRELPALLCSWTSALIEITP